VIDAPTLFRRKIPYDRDLLLTVFGDTVVVDVLQGVAAQRTH
jgi:hypothetical protein